MAPMMHLPARAHTMQMPWLVVMFRLERRRRLPGITTRLEQQRGIPGITTQPQQRDLTILTLLPLPIRMILLPRRGRRLILMLLLVLRLIPPLQRGRMMPALLPHLVPMILQLKRSLRMLMLLLIRLMSMRQRDLLTPALLRTRMIPRLALQEMILWLLRRSRGGASPQYRSKTVNEEKRVG